MPPMMLRKKYNHTVSTLKGSNKVVACSKADWLSVKDGGYFSVSGDNEFYKIVSKNKIFFVRNVTVLNGDSLRIEENVGNNLLINDVLAFVNKEYELAGVSILGKGQGYKVGDSLTVEGGVCKYNSVDQINIPTEFLVTSVSGIGEVESLSVKSKGVYNEAPVLESATTGGSGNSVKLHLTYKSANALSVDERSITHIERMDNYSIVYINHPLPPRVKEGIISLNKWEIQLSSEYLKENKFDVNYEIVKDFTPNLNLPLINDGASSVYLSYNESMMILDKKIEELTKKINSLGSN